MYRLLQFCTLANFLIGSASFSSLPPIQDSQKLFSREAKGKVTAIIKNIKQLHNVNLYFETVKQIPFSNVESALEGKPDPLFEAWSNNHMNDRGATDILLSISEPQAIVLVFVGSQLKSEGRFTESDKSIVASHFAKRLELKRNDQALVESAQLVLTALGANKSGKPLSRPASKFQEDPTPHLTAFWRGVSYATAGLLVVLLLVSLTEFLFCKFWPQKWSQILYYLKTQQNSRHQA